jgi:hypothetical protein
MKVLLMDGRPEETPRERTPAGTLSLGRARTIRFYIGFLESVNVISGIQSKPGYDRSHTCVLRK